MKVFIQLVLEAGGVKVRALCLDLSTKASPLNGESTKKISLFAGCCTWCCFCPCAVMQEALRILDGVRTLQFNNSEC